jgi:hypothetical protein
MTQRPKVTADELREYWISRNLSTNGIDFEALAAAQSGPRDVPNWEPPRVLPASWREVERGSDGAKYMNAAARLLCIMSCSIELDGRAWLHLSVSHVARIPTWGEMRVCKEQFLGDREAYSIMPPRARYVNIHPRVLHLFALLEEKASALPDFTAATGSL